MAAKELTVVILNHTNEELQVQPESPQLELGELLDPSKPSPPKNILAGESVIWSFRSAHIGGGIQGQVAYQMVGFEENASVTFHWSVHLVGTNKFTHTSSVDGFTTRVLGGSGQQPVAVFVLEQVKILEMEDYCDSYLDPDLCKSPRKSPRRLSINWPYRLR